jgi:hypothetical protein
MEKTGKHIGGRNMSLIVAKNISKDLWVIATKITKEY